MDVQVPLWNVDLEFLNKYTEVVSLVSMVALVFAFRGIDILISLMAALIYIHTTVCKGLLPLTSS